MKQGAVEYPSKPPHPGDKRRGGEGGSRPFVDVIHGDCGCGFKGMDHRSRLSSGRKYSVDGVRISAAAMETNNLVRFSLFF
ncbi:hypothetical protein ASPBRDRAFT_319357 [Aspergillus brasiliensis CBS 101740]|uniref:Uncharacterized protein n=1 Tax=Aspergillus brasiliensis (strain CBS 101740 / IMI 381727 / IBT 21946) TaxID=767769 RepID=A0A1L9U921_ASPBC|nr:hypothetical protein ASPBRDRAFT_319357 [Aspergillus brasiliensis CBS 101740]